MNSFTISHIFAFLAFLLPLDCLGKTMMRHKNQSHNSDNGQYLLQKQLADLNKVGCRPRLTVVRVRDQLKNDDPIQNDKHLHPEMIAVKRCLPESSFCGDSEGRPTQSCTPIKKRTKVVMLETSSQQKLIQVEEHAQCGCQSRTWDMLENIAH